MQARGLPLLALVLLPCAGGSLQSQSKPLTEATARRLHAALCPTTKARWERIPWTVDLLAARARANREGKPLFMWSMNGHPLGCT